MEKQWKQWETLFFWAQKSLHMIDCSHEIKRCLLLGRKVMTNLDSILKSRDITLPTKVHVVKAMVFPVFMYGCESWTIKKAECRRIYAFKLWCWRRLLRVPWTASWGHQSWIFIGRTNAEAEAPIFLPPDVKKWLIWKVPDVRKDWGQEKKGGWDGWMASLTQWTWVSAKSVRVKDREARCAAVHGITESQRSFGDWTAATWNYMPFSSKGIWFNFF